MSEPAIKLYTLYFCREPGTQQQIIVETDRRMIGLRVPDAAVVEIEAGRLDDYRQRLMDYLAGDPAADLAGWVVILTREYGHTPQRVDFWYERLDDGDFVLSFNRHGQRPAWCVECRGGMTLLGRERRYWYVEDMEADG